MNEPNQSGFEEWLVRDDKTENTAEHSYLLWTYTPHERLVTRAWRYLCDLHHQDRLTSCCARSKFADVSCSSNPEKCLFERCYTEKDRLGMIALLEDMQDFVDNNCSFGRPDRVTLVLTEESS